jgi:membrane fusion protein, heavy metal efflux system
VKNKTDEEQEEFVIEMSENGKSKREKRVEEVREVKRPRRRDRTAIIAIVTVVGIAAISVLVWWLTSGRKGAGQPVPAPRMVSNGQQTGDEATVPMESTVRLSPEVTARSGIKVEQVGEQLATSTDGTGGIPATGVIQANSYRTTPVVSLVGGILRQVGAELGQSVRKGQPVAVVFSDELAMAQSKYLSSLADLDEQQKHYKRTVQLVEIGAASREELEQANTKVKTAEAEVGAGRQRLILLGLSPQRVNSLKDSSQISSEVSMPAPVSGTVIARNANPGEVIEANKEVLKIADLSSVWVIGQVFEKDLASVRVGSGASITSQAYPGRVFRGRVSYVDPNLDPQTRTAQVRVELANPGQVFKIGMYVNVAFATLGGSENIAPTIPVSALQNINNQQVVFLATSDPNVFAMRPVRVGPEVNGVFTALEGLRVGDRVVTEGSFMLRAEWLKLNPGGTSSSGAAAAASPPHAGH